MARRYQGHMNGERYCGNASSNEVHDLDHEQANCQIDEIIAAGNDRPFYTLAVAHVAGCDQSCHWCLRDARP
jgi:hypothetical protein